MVKSGFSSDVPPLRLFVVADVNGPRTYHLGDEAMLEANVRTVRQMVPGVEFTALSGDPDWTSRRYQIKSVRIPGIPQGHTSDSWTREMVETGSWAEWLGCEIATALRGSDGLIISGGGNVCASWPERVLERVGLIELAGESGIPAVMSGQTLGPALTSDQRELLSRSLVKLNWLGVRDADSAALARNLGVPAERIHRQIDDAFFLEPLAVTGARSDFLLDEHRRWIAITLDASFGAPARARSLAVLAGELQALADSLDASLLFVPHVGGDDAGDAASDAVAGRALAAQLSSELLQLGLWQPREVRWLTEHAIMVVSTRYHPLVFATAAGIPALGIWTDDYTRTKLRGALAPACLEGWCVPVAEVDRGAFLPLALELWHRRDTVRDRMSQLRAEAESWEARRWDEIRQALGLKAQSEPAAGSPGAPPVSITPRNPVFSSKPGILIGEQWNRYCRDGYLRLGRLLDERELAALREGLDAIAPGRRVEAGVRDSQEALPARTVDLPRTMPGLESNLLVLKFFRRELFREICAWHYGAHASISLFRTMLVGEHAGPRAREPWRQNGGAGWNLDRDPLVTLWVALDPATRVNGCLQVIPGTHRLGLLDRDGVAFAAERYLRNAAIEHLELESGEGLLLHNWLLQRNDIDPAGVPARALSACYMDGRTLNTLSGQRFPVVFGEHVDLESATPILLEMREENRHLRETLREATRYVNSLIEDNQHREQMRRDAEKYAKSLEAELAKIRAAATQRDAP